MNNSKQPELTQSSSSRLPSEANPEPTYLYVPFAEKDQAKKLGAHWDKGARAWFIPPGKPTAPFGRWLDAPPLVVRPAYLELHLVQRDDDDLLAFLNATPSMEAVLMDYPCWRCHQIAPAFYGLGAQGGLLAIDVLYWPETIEEISAFAKQQNIVPPGTVKPRFSKTLGRQSVTQGCPRCDSIFGDPFVRQQAIDHAMNLPLDYPLRFELQQWPPDSLHDYLNDRGL